MKVMSSKERVLAAIRREPVDYVPLSVLLWSSLWAHCGSVEEYVRRQLDFGMDPVVPLPGPPWGEMPDVEVRTWREDTEPYPLLHKVYSTPAGDLEAVAQLTPDWPHGEDVPLFSDFNIPRSREFLVTGPEDLAPLAHLLRPPDAAAIEQFRVACRNAQQVADRFGLATVTSPVRLADTVCWLCGPAQMALWALDRPRFLAKLIRIIARWQQALAEIALEQKPDIRVRAEWYASPFLSPPLFRRFLGPWFRRDIKLAHGAGAAYCYVGTARMMPFLSNLIAMGVDVLYGIDPVEGDWDLEGTEAFCRRRMALWGGINGYLQVVDAEEPEIRAAVARALEALAPLGGFLLSPVDDIGLSGTDRDTPETWHRVIANVAHMAAAWRELR
jgi:hypothetical protein